MRRREFLLASSLGAILPAAHQARADALQPVRRESDFCKRLRPLGRILELDGYFVWCNSPLYGPDGRVHVFYSRWPKRKGMGGWINCCEIAHAVANQPRGPYTTLDVVLAPRPGRWDATTCHNPHVQRVDDKYCLFYMGNSNGRTNTKRIGLATADSLEGPWERSDQPLLLPGPEGAWDDHCTTNPSFIRRPNGENLLYYKSWNSHDYETDKPPIRGNRKYGLAVSEALTGPYRKHPENPLIDFSGLGANQQCEDAYVWRQDGTFKMIARDMGVFDHEVGLYLESADGVHWSPPMIGYYPLKHYVDQPPAPRGLRRYGRLERPQLLLRDGVPTHLFGASQGGAYGTASGFVFELA